MTDGGLARESFDTPLAQKVTERHGKIAAAFWTIPLNLVSLWRGVRGASLIEAQRDEARERTRRLRLIESTASSKT